MVYIYKKTVGGKPYYYLRVSERKGEKVVAKDIAYLGNSIDEVKKALESPKYKNQIRKAYKTLHNFLESNHYIEKAISLKLKKDEFLTEKIVEIEACKLHYNSVFKNKDSLTKQETLKGFVIEFAFNTSSIEGNTITLQQARNLLDEGLTPKDKTLREIYDLQNSENVFLSLFKSNKEISHDFIIDVHSRLMKNIDMRTGYRTDDVRIIKANFKSTPFPYIKDDMNLLLKWYNNNKNKLHPLVLGVMFHHKFEKIHPFMDGNGRTGRIILNCILIKNNYPPIIIRKKFRNEYLDALKVADKSGLMNFERKDYFSLIQFAAKEFTEGYWGLFL